MNTVYNVSYSDRIKKQEIQEEALVSFTYKQMTLKNMDVDDY
jgi:hypothetical protein